MTREELYLSILNHIQDGVYYVDVHRKIEFWNKGAEQITGYKADEIVGQDCPSTKLNHIDEFAITCASRGARCLRRTVTALSARKKCS